MEGSTIERKKESTHEGSAHKKKDREEADEGMKMKVDDGKKFHIKKEGKKVRRKEVPDITLLADFFRIPCVHESTESPDRK